MTSKIERLHIVAGATASGKTAAAIALAKQYNCSIINGDSRQVYAEMVIGTARPSSKEMAEAPHLLFGTHSIHEPLSAGSFAREARELIQKELEQNEHVIVCGGSGLYLQAILYGFNAIPDVSPDFRTQLNLEFLQTGIRPLQLELREKDPAYFEKVDIQNHQRLIRALEIIRATGNTFSSFRDAETEGIGIPFSVELIQIEKEILHNRIQDRVLNMIEAGLEAEVEALFEFKHLQALQTVGYSEWWPYFEKQCSKEAVIETIILHTKQYAKRQQTWFQKYLKGTAI